MHTTHTHKKHSRRTKRRTHRKGGGSINALLNYMTKRPDTPDYEKASKKITKIINKLSRAPATSLKSYKIPHVDRIFNLSSMPATLDGFEPEGDDAAKFLKTLGKLPYGELKKLNTDPHAWSENNSDAFMMMWKSTPSPKKMPSVSGRGSGGGGGGYFTFLTGKSKKKSRTKKGKKGKKGKKSKKGKKGKKGRTQRR